MKKIFYIFLLMISGFVWGQIVYPTIHPLQGGFTFEGEKLDHYTQVFGATTPTGCNFQFSNDYKYYSFKAGFDMVFAFDLISTKPDFNFIVWKLSTDKQPTAIFDRGGTIYADRSVYDKVKLVKGMGETETDKCEYSNGNGYVNAFQGSEILKKNETIVIAIYGLNSTDTFDIKINVAEERKIETFNNLCSGQSYTYNQIYDAVKTDSSLTDIKLYTDSTFNTVIPAGTTFNSDTTIYAQVRNASGDLKYIYTIPLKFIPEHVFNFKPTFDTEFECTNTYTIPTKDYLLNKLFGSVNPDYSITSIAVDGIAYAIGNTVPLTNNQTTSIKIKVHYNGTCPIDSEEKSIPLNQGTPILDANISDVTCDTSYRVIFDQIYSKLGKDKNVYDLIVTLNGSTISDGSFQPITTTLTYKVKIKTKGAGSCESNEVDFVVTKTSPANIANAEIKNICLDDFSQADVNNAITTIQNGNLYQLKYYQTNGTPIAFADLFTYIRTTKQGKIIVKALALENTAICDTEVELTFNLGVSSFVKVDNIPTLNSTCAEVGTGYTFTKTEIETYLKSKLGRADITFEGVGNETLAANASKTIRFKVKLNSESCWSEEMELKLQVITKPNVINAVYTNKFCDGETLSIDDNLLKSYFGNNIFDYLIFIDGIEYRQGTSIQKTLNFGTNNSLNLSLEFKNRLNETCSTLVKLTINKKPTLITPPNLNSDIEARKIVYCEDNIDAAKTQLTTLLNYIRSTYNLEARITAEEIFNQFTDDENFVEVVFYNPNSCGEIKLKIGYQKNGLPNIVVPAKGLICTNTLFELAFTTQTDYANYNYSVEKADGTRIIGIDNFQLDAGTYKVTIEDKITLCSVVKTLVVENSPEPILEKITVNEKSIIVTAKGSGKLEYALFDEAGNIVVAWQTNNELIIPENITNNNFTVKVRLNNCGVVTYTNIIYLALPSFISPNNDGKNDFWEAMTKNGKVNDTTNSYRLIIFDRYGKQFLNKEGIDIIKWDGTHLGKPVADGTYWYLLEPIGESGILQVKYTGSIVVKRKIN